jgi:hypothetical protein
MLKHSHSGTGSFAYHLLSAEEMTLCVAIGQRASKLITEVMRLRKNMEIEVNPLIVAQDIATVHLQRPLALLAFCHASNFLFLDDVMAVQTNLDRACGKLPNFVKLHHEDEQAAPKSLITSHST